ncbi:MAG: hypothetical protein QOH32_413 [Bradyrhizobium sp.]|nr:hypothetical protein [Bradyrhizobium sp.]
MQREALLRRTGIVQNAEASIVTAPALQRTTPRRGGALRSVRGTAPYADFSNSSRPISMRRISLVPAPISYSLASRKRRPVG